jgi:lycopene cyclase domain-containing protein
VSYTGLAVTAVLVVIALDLAAFRTRLLTRKLFWTAYAIIVFFQLVTNGVLTGLRIVRYDGAHIIGSTTPGAFGDTGDRLPTFIGDGRIAFAPVEDLMFGFAMVLLTLILWVTWGRLGVQRTPVSGPPVWRRGTSRTSRPAGDPGEGSGAG